MKFLSSFFVLAVLLGFQSSEKSYFTAPTETDIETLISQMSIEEKVGQTCQITLDAIHKTNDKGQALVPAQIDQAKLKEAMETYHIGSVLNVGWHTLELAEWKSIMADIHAPYLKKEQNIPILYGIDAIHGVNYTVGGTLFPQEIGLAATWNTELARQMGEVTAYECRASGIPWNFSPVLDLGRQPLWSRHFETLGEDPVLGSQMGVGLVEGYQGKGETVDEFHAAACLKHFVGYSASFTGRDRTPAFIPEKYMQELYFPAFKAAVEKGALTLMINSGVVNGIPGHANYQLLTQTLKKDWGFKGFVVSDWEDFIMLHTVHKTAPSLAEAVVQAFNAGVDMSMVPSNPQYKAYCQDMIKAVKDGKISMARLDDAVRRILYVKNQLGLFGNPLPDMNKYPLFGSQTFKNIAKQAALESITLLKNDAQTLPLKSAQRILLAGPSAASLNMLNGAWTHTWQGLDTSFNTKGALNIYQALKQQMPNSAINYAKGVELYLENNFEASRFVDINNYKKALKKNDIIVICVGELPSTEKPGDIRSLQLDDKQKELVRLAKAAKKKVILVLLEARPRIINDIEPLCDAIIQAYLPGDQGGVALAELLTGKAEFSGRLPYTYPRFDGVIEFYDHPGSVARAKSGQITAYNPQWDFGFGLSYHAGSINGMQFTAKDENNGAFSLAVNVSNPHSQTIQMVVPVYLSDLYASTTPENKRLIDFSKVTLRPGENKTLEFTFDASVLKRVSADGKWRAEKGTFEIICEGNKLSFELFNDLLF
ncbi:MAG: glycoside hydrolase family 3 C-terminal domain-containing protein [Cryomorphaceae bacterium]|jgi:beta-glucosidase|nr:glycoside hydrolase family 3 C-terminal domain-containing protein [Cryomorphaceae bacterium]